MEVSNRFLAFNLAKRSNFFLNKALSFKPVYARFKVTGNCNLRCTSCDHWRTDSHREPTLDEVREAADQFKEVGITHVGITGGEPTLRNDLEDIIEIFDQKGMQLGMTSNGLGATQKRVENLVEKGLDSLNVSLDGPEEVHNSIRGKKFFNRIFKNLYEISEFSKNGGELHLTSGTVLSSKNLGVIKETVYLKKGIGVPTTVIPLDSSLFFNEGEGLTVDDYEELDDTIDELIRIKRSEPNTITNPVYSLRYIKRYYRAPRMPELPCTNGYLMLNIDNNLDVYPCWGLAPVGNLREDRLEDVLDSEQYKEIQKKMFKKECPGCSCGHIPRLASHSISNAISFVRNQTYNNQF